MKNTLETLRDGLLVFTVILLIYVLYTRLLRILGKKEKSKQYPTLSEELVWENENELFVQVTLEENDQLELILYNSNDEQCLSLEKKGFDSGTHEFQIDMQSFPSGRYYLKLISNHQEASRYFDKP